MTDDNTHNTLHHSNVIIIVTQYVNNLSTAASEYMTDLTTVANQIQMHRQTNRHTHKDRQTDRQTDTHTHTTQSQYIRYIIKHVIISFMSHHPHQLVYSLSANVLYLNDNFSVYTVNDRANVILWNTYQTLDLNGDIIVLLLKANTVWEGLLTQGIVTSDYC